MQRHVNDWAGTLKAAIPFLQMVQCNANFICAMTHDKDNELAEVLNEARDIVAAAEEQFVARPKQPLTLVQELAQVINRRSLESGSDTPDFILADYLGRCLVAFDDCTKQRTKWYGLEAFNKTGEKPTSPIAEAKQAIYDYYKTRSHWDAEALKKRQFPAGGVVMPHHFQWCNPGAAMNSPECGGSFEARKQASKPITDEMADRIIDKTKEAGRQIMEDIEKQTADTLHGFKKSFAYVPTDLLEEFNRTNAALAKMWDEGQRTTQEYKDLQNKVNVLLETMNKVKKEAIEKEARESMGRMVADAMKITDSFVKAAKAIQLFNREAKEADATRKKFEHMEPKTGNGGKKPITDEKGFLFISTDGDILWALHDGERYMFRDWDCGCWTGWQVEKSAIIEAGHTQLPLFLDDFVRKIMPTE